MADLDPDDFASLRSKMAKRWGPVTLGNAIQRSRVIFKFAWDNGLIERPVRYGQNFKRPSRKTVRIDRAKKDPRLFSAEEVCRLLDAAGPTMRAMILLGTNGGFGNADCGHLPVSAVTLDAAMIDFPRPKTGISRRCPLWTETVDAIRDASKRRPARNLKQLKSEKKVIGSPSLHVICTYSHSLAPTGTFDWLSTRFEEFHLVEVGSVLIPEDSGATRGPTHHAWQSSDRIALSITFANSVTSIESHSFAQVVIASSM